MKQFCSNCGHRLKTDTLMCPICNVQSVSTTRDDILTQTLIKRRARRDAWRRPLSILGSTLSALFHRGVLVAFVSLIVLLFVAFFVAAIAFALWPLTIAVVTIYAITLLYTEISYIQTRARLNTISGTSERAEQLQSSLSPATHTAGDSLALLDADALLGLKQDLYGDSDLRRDQAAKTLGKMGDPAVGPLINALNDPRASVRRSALSALEELKDQRAVVPLTTLLVDTDSQIRRTAAEFLGQFGNSEAVDPLLQALDGDDVQLTVIAARALGDIGDRRAVDSLSQLTANSDPRVRDAAAEALHMLSVAPTVAPLSTDGAARNTCHRCNALLDPRARFCRQCGQPVGSVGRPQAVEAEVDGRPDPQVLIETIADKSSADEAKAASRNRDIRAPKLAVDILGKTENVQEIEDIDYQSKKIKGQTQAHQIVDASLHPNQTCRRCNSPFEAHRGAANRVLCPECVQELNVAARSAYLPTRTCEHCKKQFKPSSEGQRFCSQSCGARARSWTEAKREGRKIPTPALREGGDALVKTGDESAVDPILSRYYLKRERGIEDRHFELDAIIHIDPTEATEPLIYELESGNGEMQEYAVRALGDIGDTRAVEPLIYKLILSTGKMRELVIRALGNIGDKRAVEPLIKTLNVSSSEELSNQNPEFRTVRKLVIEALGDIGDRRAVEPLLRIVSSADPCFSDAALVVRRFRGDDVEERLKKCIAQGLRSGRGDPLECKKLAELLADLGGAGEKP